MTDNMWFDSLQKPFCKNAFFMKIVLLSLVSPSSWVNKCTKDKKKSCHLCIFIKSKGNLIMWSKFKC